MTRTLPEFRYLGRRAGLLVGIGAAIGLLADLAGLTLRQWDEARLAVSAIEMTQRSNWFVVTYGFQPDLWNTKPPLMVWLQAGLILLLGPSEWAIRLPAALAALASIGLVYWLLAKFLRRPVSGLIAGIVIISALGYVGEHHGRSGDYDALLTLAELGAGVSLLLLLETGRRRWWLGVGLGLIAATLTKGVAALLPLPGVALYCLVLPRGRRLLLSPWLWLTLLLWGAAAVGWYYTREQLAPGYWQAVDANELSGRFATVLDDHVGPWYYYVKEMTRSKFLPWVYLVLPAIPFAVRHPDARARRVAWFALAWAMSLLLVLSVAKTKIAWYAVPAYPWLAIVIGVGAPRLARAVYLLVKPNSSLRTGLRFVFVVLLVVSPLATIWRVVRTGWTDKEAEVRPGYGLRALGREAAPPAPLAVVAPTGFYQSFRPLTAVGGQPGYNASLRFYLLAYPRSAQIIPPNELRKLRGPGYILTTTSADSAQVQATFPQLPHRPVGRYACWLWTLPSTARLAN
ncbi:glycosyltransferase family 39 protein [Hymenobacter sp.]|uniref:ArnT family glycosyltransferase n=1 Tax=Hymenobacter sp. TaxID=1898978 RepID=UPI00286D152B|nr:glycosyltransferase family 39 protein [Hymenobacter sp.]